jgi:hypothetical protein
MEVWTVRAKRVLLILLCFALIVVAFPHTVRAEEGEKKQITFEILDGTTRQSVIESVYEDLIFELYNAGQPVGVEVTSESVSANLTIDETYDLKVAHRDYYTVNEHFTIQADTHVVSVLLSKRADITVVPESAITSELGFLEGETPTIEVSIVEAALPEGFDSDKFSIVLMPGETWDVENDGFPPGTWQAPPQLMNESRHERIDSGEYVLFVGFFKDMTGEFGYPALVGYATKSVVVPGEEPVPEGHVKVTVSVFDSGIPVQDALVRLEDGGTEPLTRSTDASGNATFTLVVGCNYDLEVEKEGYYRTNERFEALAEDDHISVSIYAKADVDSDIDFDSVVSAVVYETDNPMVEVSITDANPNCLVPDQFSVVLIPGTWWMDAEQDGMPPGMRHRPEAMDSTWAENVTPGGYVLFVSFFSTVERSEGEGGPYSVLLGYTAKIIEVSTGGGGHGEPPPGDSGPLVFDYTLIDPGPEATGSVEINFDTRTDVFLVPIPASNAGSIVFPSTFDGKELTWLRMDDCFPFAEFSPQDFGGSFDGGELSYAQPFKRIRLFAELEGEGRPYAFILCQPGYEAFELRFSLNGAEDQYVMEHDGTWEKRHAAFELPADLQSGTIEVTVNWQDSENQDDIGPIGGGIWEYLVDRSDYVTHDFTILTFSRHFGKVTLHYGFQAGYSWEDAMVTFYEPDLVSIDVLPKIGAGDWHTGIVNASEASLSVMTPSAFVYFLNEKVFIRPSDVGRPFEITSVTSSEEGVESTQGELWFDPEAWAVTLPDITNPVTRLSLTLLFEDDTIQVVPLDIKRVLLDAFSLEFDGRDDLTPGETLWTPRMTEYEYRGEDFISFVGVFPFTETDQYDPNYFEIDHTLLVNYYKDDILLGARQFEAYAGSDDFRHEIPVFRKGAPEYADVASANRITAFLISKEGISADDSTFGGAVFGIGAGWGHLMPNHAEYGSGKDGMDYE